MEFIELIEDYNIYSKMEKKIKEYTILGKVYKAKEIKLQLNKESYNLLRKLNEYIKEASGLSDEEMRCGDNSFTVSLAIMGFLSLKENCSDVLSLLLTSENDWLKIIGENENKYEEIKMTAVNVLNDFFLNVTKLMKGQKN